MSFMAPHARHLNKMTVMRIHLSADTRGLHLILKKIDLTMSSVSVSIRKDTSIKKPVEIKPISQSVPQEVITALAPISNQTITARAKAANYKHRKWLAAHPLPTCGKVHSNLAKGQDL